MLIALRWLTDLAPLPGARISEEIVRDRDVNVGLVEGALAVGPPLCGLHQFAEMPQERTSRGAGA